jgi:hypothetical protein
LFFCIKTKSIGCSKKCSLFDVAIILIGSIKMSTISINYAHHNFNEVFPFNVFWMCPVVNLLCSVVKNWSLTSLLKKFRFSTQNTRNLFDQKGNVPRTMVEIFSLFVNYRQLVKIKYICLYRCQVVFTRDNWWLMKYLNTADEHFFFITMCTFSPN